MNTKVKTCSLHVYLKEDKGLRTESSSQIEFVLFVVVLHKLCSSDFAKISLLTMKTFSEKVTKRGKLLKIAGMPSSWMICELSKMRKVLRQMELLHYT